MCTAVLGDRVDKLKEEVKKSIQFTVELECDGKLPFLDLLLSHETDKYLDLSLMILKKPVVSTLLARVCSHFSSSSTATVELNQTVCALQ